METKGQPHVPVVSCGIMLLQTRMQAVAGPQQLTREALGFCVAAQSVH